MQTFGWPEAMFIFRAAGWTLLLTAISFAIGSLIGGAFAIMRLSRIKLVRNFAAGYILVIQSIPVLMVLFMSYYGLSIIGIGLPPFLAASASLAVYVSAYLAEIWRGSIESVPYQQWEASASLAHSPAQTYRYVILPQAIRISLPATIGFLVQLIKGTSLASIIGFVELTRAAQIINNATFRPFTIFALVALVYYVICRPLSAYSKRMEQKLLVAAR